MNDCGIRIPAFKHFTRTMTKHPFPNRRAVALLLVATALPLAPAFAQDASVAPPPVTTTVAPPPAATPAEPAAPVATSPIATPSVAPPPISRTAPTTTPTTVADAPPVTEAVVAPTTEAPERPAATQRRAPRAAPAAERAAPAVTTPVAAAPQPAPVAEPPAPPAAAAAPVAAETTPPPAATSTPAATQTDRSTIMWIAGGVLALLVIAGLALLGRRRSEPTGAPLDEQPSIVPTPAYAPQATAAMDGDAVIEPVRRPQSQPVFNAAPASAAMVAAAHDRKAALRDRFAGEPIDPYLAEVARRRPVTAAAPVDPYLAEIERRRTTATATSEPLDPYLAEVQRRRNAPHPDAAPVRTSREPELV